MKNRTAAEVVGSQFDLVLIAAQRVRELRRGEKPAVERQRSDTTTAIREIELGYIDSKEYLKRVRLESIQQEAEKKKQRRR